MKIIQTTIRIPEDIYNKILDIIHAGKKLRKPNRIKSINKAAIDGLKRVINENESS